jgi:hypothetical protein
MSATLQSNEKVSTSNTIDNDFYANTKSSLDNYLLEEEVLTFKEVGDLGSSQIFMNEHDQDQQTHNQNLSLSLEGFEFLDHVDYVDNPVELEKLNGHDLHVLNPTDVDDIFKHGEATGNMSIMKDGDIFNWRERQKNKSEDENQKTKIDGFKETNLKTRHDIVTTKYKCKVKSNIIQFLVKTISEYYLDFYIKRLTVLEESFTSLKIFDSKHHGENNVLYLQDCELVKVLNQLHYNFGNKKEFNQETYQAFNIEFSLLQLEDKMLFYEVPTVNLSQNYERNSFYFEFMKLYKYIYEMPELLMLADIYKDDLFCGIPNIIHLIDLFKGKIGSLKDNKVLILCLINKAYSYSPKCKKAFFCLTKYNIICSKEHTNFDFLLWEIHPVKRSNMRKRLKWRDIIICNKKDDDHFKAVLVIYLYHHFEFLIFYDFKDEEINNFCAFIDKVLFSNDCFACLFDEYLEILRRQIISLK